MKWVFDSSSLIYLGKIEILHKLTFLEGERIIPSIVYKEVIERGLKRKEPEVEKIISLIDSVFSIRKSKKDIFYHVTLLSDADREVLSLAKEMNAFAIIDEKRARNVAETFGIEYHGLIYVLLKLLEKKKITKKEARAYIDKIIQLGFYLSNSLYQETIKVIERM